MIKIGVIGFGRMGKEIIKEAVGAGMKIVAVVDAPQSPAFGKDAGVLSGIDKLGVDVSSAENLGATLEKTKPDVVIDFSSVAATIKNSKTVSDKKINLVIGTTGLSEKELSEIKDNVKKNNTGAVISPNMSIGVNVFWKLTESAAKKLSDYDIEIIEKHHRFKKDAPSGTAMKTAQVIADAIEIDLKEKGVYGRKGMKERAKGEIGIHAIRAGDIVGEHTVIFCTLGETIELTHKAHSRSVFTKGAIKAAEYVKGKKGVYGMDDVLNLK
jgi:4-hydroxy-tetrahydrodipicolinate reductase